MDEPGASTGASTRGLTMQEAAVAMGVSLNTMRRWCATGRVRSERISRPQGYTVRVYLDQVPTQEPQVEGAAQEPPPSNGQEPPGTYQQAPADLVRAEAMAAYNRELVAPLVAELAAYRERLEDLARQNGTLTAELDQARARIAELERPPEPMPAPDPAPEPIPPTSNVAPWWQRFRLTIALAVLMVVMAAMVAAPAWGR